MLHDESIGGEIVGGNEERIYKVSACFELNDWGYMVGNMRHWIVYATDRIDACRRVASTMRHNFTPVGDDDKANYIGTAVLLDGKTEYWTSGLTNVETKRMALIF